jgi:hypothetical protein
MVDICLRYGHRYKMLKCLIGNLLALYLSRSYSTYFTVFRFYYPQSNEGGRKWLARLRLPSLLNQKCVTNNYSKDDIGFPSIDLLYLWCRVHCNNPLVILCVESTPPTGVLRRRRRSLGAGDATGLPAMHREETGLLGISKEETSMLDEEEYTSLIQSMLL